MSKESLAQKMLWFFFITLVATLISITGGWVGAVNAYMMNSSKEHSEFRALIQSVNSQYSEIIRMLQEDK